MEHGPNSYQKAKVFVRENLTEMCREIIEWHDTGMLPGTKVREAAEIAVADPRFVENIVSSEAMRLVGQTGLRNPVPTKEADNG